MRYGLLGKLSRLLRAAVGGQVPHDMSVQVVEVNLTRSRNMDVDVHVAARDQDVADHVAVCDPDVASVGDGGLGGQTGSAVQGAAIGKGEVHDPSAAGRQPGRGAT